MRAGGVKTWVWEGEVGAAGRRCERGGESVSLLQLAVALSVSLCSFIVPLLCWRYKYTPVGPQGDSLDRLTTGDRLINRLNGTHSERNTGNWKRLKLRKHL